MSANITFAQADSLWRRRLLRVRYLRLLFGPTDSATIIEGPTRGFVLDSVVCEGFSSPVVITEMDNGIIAECNSANDEGTCTFVNVRGLTSTAIPTLSEWGLIGMAGIMGIIGFFVAMSRRKAKEVEL